MKHEMFVRKPQQELEKLNQKIESLREQVRTLQEKAKHLEFTIDYNRSQITNGSNGEHKGGVGRFSGMTLLASTIEVFDSVHRPMNSVDLTDHLLKRGFVTQSQNPRRYIYLSLSREAKKPNSRIAKRGPLFGISSWGEEVWDRA